MFRLGYEPRASPCPLVEVAVFHFFMMSVDLFFSEQDLCAGPSSDSLPSEFLMCYEIHHAGLKTDELITDFVLKMLVQSGWRQQRLQGVRRIEGSPVPMTHTGKLRRNIQNAGHLIPQGTPDHEGQLAGILAIAGEFPSANS